MTKVTMVHVDIGFKVRTVHYLRPEYLNISEFYKFEAEH